MDPTDPSTWTAAACLGHDRDRWFAPRTDPETDDAKRICRNCTIRDTCLDYAVTRNITDGIWGGLDPTEIATLRRRTRNRRPRGAA